MRYLVYLMTLLFVGTAIAQNPTIVQGNYITNVFGNSNFVLNPNALTNVANVTNATRSTTTPLVATSEFTLSLASGANATWTLRAFDGGMKGQNCEARFTYRGFATATTKAEIVQNSLVVASLTLTPTTDPRIASINFPCGDLANLTTFRIAQTTANMTGTNEIGGIYVGLATNMANVAQAVEYGSVTFTSCSATWTTSGSGAQWESFPTRTGCSYSPTGNASAPSTNIPAIQFSNLPIGNYQIVLSGAFGRNAAQTGAVYFRARTTDGAFTSNPAIVGTTTTAQNQYSPTATFNLNITSAGSKTIEIQGFNNNLTSATIIGQTTPDTTQLTVYRFPSSSELVVTPERQNVFGGVDWSSSADFTGTATTYTQVNVNFGTPNVYGMAKAPAASCGLTTNDVGFCIDTLPPGTYRVTGNFQVGLTPTVDGDLCSFVAVVGGGTLSDTYVADALPRVGKTASTTFPFQNIGSGLIKITSMQQNVRVSLKYKKNGSATNCILRSENSTSGYLSRPSLQILPADQPSNSALYVQGPVLGAQTGAAISAGYVGEEVKQASATSITTTTTIDTEIDVTNATITLGVGVWELEYAADVRIDRTPASANTVYGRIRVTDASNVNESGMETFYGFANATSNVSSSISSGSKRKRILITSGTKTFKLRITCSETNTVATCQALNGSATGGISGDDASTYIRAVRIN